jgi:hypothetical protein
MTSPALKSLIGIIKNERQHSRAQNSPKGLFAIFLPRELLDSEIDAKIRKKVTQDQKESIKRNEHGTYRNASLFLASIFANEQKASESYREIIKTVYLDMQGCLNSMPGHPCFDKKLSNSIQFICEALFTLASQLGKTDEQIFSDFSYLGQRLRFFANPPFPPDMVWKKILKTINSGSQRANPITPYVIADDVLL